MPPIRQLIFTILMMILLTYGAILWIGGYESTNGLQESNSIASNYNSIVLASACNTGAATNTLFGSVTGVCVAAANASKGVNNTGNQASQAVTNSVSLVIGFMLAIPGVIGQIIFFVATPLVALGINLGYAEAIVTTLFLAVIALAIISAIFLFPI